MSMNMQQNHDFSTFNKRYLLVFIVFCLFMSLMVISQLSQTSALPLQHTSGKYAFKHPIPLPTPNPGRNHRKINLQKPLSKSGASLTKIRSRLNSDTIRREPVLSDAFKTLKPALANSVTEQEKSQLQKVMHLVRKKKFSAAATYIDTIKPGIQKDLANWFYLRKTPPSVPGTASRLQKFLKKRGNWPSAGYLKKRLEQAIVKENRSPEEIIAAFAGKNMRTLTGKLDLAKSWLATGNNKRALRIIRPLWHSTAVGNRTAKEITELFGKLLKHEDHLTRNRYFLSQNKRRSIKYAKQAEAFLSAEEKRVIEVQIAFIRKFRNALNKYNALPDKLKETYALQFNRAVWYRRKKQEETAWKILSKRSLPVSKYAEVFMKKDWRERRYMVRQAVNKNYQTMASKIIAAYHQSGSPNEESLFLEGWIHLKLLKRPGYAQKVFSRLRKISRSRRAMAKADFWIATSYKSLGNNTRATNHLKKAASINHTYYSILAGQKLGQTAAERLIRFPDIQISSKVKKNFVSNSRVRAAILATHNGELDFQRRFLNELSWTLKSEEEMRLLLELANQIAPAYSLIKLGKVALYRGFDLAPYGFPLDILPSHKLLTEEEVPNDFVHALIRQESEFNPKVKSPAGARGLMQLMPGTARMVAKRHKVRYSRGKLTSDPAYNLSIGKALLRKLLDDYNNSYLLTLVAYNAGPGRVRSWTREFGDPRLPEIDVIDWVERIPFLETRKYVKRIMTNLMTYRGRMGMRKNLNILTALKGHPPAPQTIQELLTTQSGTTIPISANNRQ